MKSSQLHHSRLLHGLLATLLISAAGATYAATSLLPQERTQGEVSYLSGGVGHGEAKAMEAAAPHYPLVLEFVGSKVGTHREYLAGDKVVIKDRSGKTVLDTISDGPYLLARLPAGSYKVIATDNGKSEHRMVAIKPNMEKKVVFEWNSLHQPHTMGG